MKYLLIIGDGMADDPVAELGGRTPLQYARTPALDAIASAGAIGSALTVPEGMQAGSDTAILSIFGSDPRSCYAGRAPLEAAASGIRLSPGDVAYRCNMVTIEDGGAPYGQKKLLSHSAGAIDGGKSIALITSLFETPAFKREAEKAGITIHPAPSFRHIAVQKKPDITGIRLAPPHDNLGIALGGILPGGCENAAVLRGIMELAHGILESHPINEALRAEGRLPANGIWFWAEGTAVKLPDFTAKYGKTGGVISAVPLCRGIGALMDLEIVDVEGATGDLHTNYEGKAESAFELLGRKDFAAVHIEAPDECTHDGDVRGKVQAIEWIDARVLAPLMERLSRSGEDFRLLVISDHKTLSSTRAHDGSPVPYAIYDSRRDNASNAVFCESEAAKGGRVADGVGLMDLLFEPGNRRNGGGL